MLVFPALSAFLQQSSFSWTAAGTLPYLRADELADGTTFDYELHSRCLIIGHNSRRGSVLEWTSENEQDGA